MPLKNKMYKGLPNNGADSKKYVDEILCLDFLCRGVNYPTLEV